MKTAVIGSGLSGLTAAALLSKAGGRTCLAHHAFGGCPPRVDKSPPPHKTPVEGLWFVGAQSEAFGGVTNAMTSSSKVVKMILEEG